MDFILYEKSVLKIINSHTLVVLFGLICDDDDDILSVVYKGQNNINVNKKIYFYLVSSVFPFFIVVCEGRLDILLKKIIEFSARQISISL